MKIRYSYTKFASLGLILLNVSIIILFLFRAFDILDPHTFVFRMDFTQYWRRSLCYLSIMILWSIYSRKKIFRTNKSGWEFSLLILMFILFIDSLGNLFGWYTDKNIYSLEWYDQLTHFANCALMTLFIFITISNAKPQVTFKLTILISTLATIILGALFEVSEYTNDSFFGTQMVGGTIDTLQDSIANTSGVLLTALILTVIWKKKRVKPFLKIDRN